MLNRKKLRVLRNWSILIGCTASVIVIIILAASSNISSKAAQEEDTTAETETEIETTTEKALTQEEMINSQVDLSTEFNIDDYIGEDGIYQASEYIEVLKYLSACPTVYYTGDDWSSWNGKAWQFDCVCLPKSILYWGWSGDKDLPNGGAVYSRRRDYTEDRMIEKCEDVSDDFSTITPGELLYMEGHVGTYIGNGLVIECTDAFGDGGVMVTEIDSDGTRSYNGQVSEHSWELHGFMTVIDYDLPAEDLD